MQRIEKTVFISYRRTNASWALAIFQNLTQNGYDVFYDYAKIAAGDFEQIILSNIKARAHFLILLTPSALERVDEPKDWLRREIETAMDTQRNIVPLMLDRFDFGSPAVVKQLTGKLAALKRYNALDVPPSYFFEAMERLRREYLNVPLEAVLHPPSQIAAQAAKQQQAAASAAPPVRAEELTAQQSFERAFAATDIDEKVRGYTEVIQLKPDFAEAYNNRGFARQRKADLDGALRDYDEAIRLKPDYATAYYNRANTRRDKGDLDGALRDYDEAIRLKPDSADAHNNRGNVRGDKGDLDGALRDYDEAIRLGPDDADVYNNRGVARKNKGDLAGALRDYDEAIRLKPDFAEAYNNRGVARKDKGDLDGALWDHDEAIRRKPDYVSAYLHRALLWESTKKRTDAIADFEKYLALGGGIRDGNQAKVEERIQKLKRK